MSRESDLIQLWLKWVESELSQVSKFGFWVESELSQVSKFGIWVESELSHLDCHMSQSRVSPKKWVEHNPASVLTVLLSPLCNSVSPSISPRIAYTTIAYSSLEHAKIGNIQCYIYMLTYWPDRLTQEYTCRTRMSPGRLSALGPAGSRLAVD